MLLGVSRKLLKPWWLSLFANIVLLMFLLFQQEGSLQQATMIATSILSGGLFVATLSFWVHHLLHHFGGIKVAIFVVMAALQAFLVLWSVSILWEFNHLPTLSEAKFFVDYPEYSLVMAWERTGYTGIVVGGVVFSAFLFSWMQANMSFQNRLHLKKTYGLSCITLLFSGYFALNMHPLQAMEVHYSQMLANTIKSMWNYQEPEDRFVANRLVLPDLIREQKQTGKKRPNIVFFRLEEVSRDYYGLYQPKLHPTSPYISDLKARSENSFFVFENHISHSGATDTSIASLYTGLLPSRTGQDYGYYPMLWDYANAAGYQTFMSIPFHLSWSHLDSKWVGADGRTVSVDHLVDAETSERPIRYDNSITDEDIADIAIQWLRERQESAPFFAIVNLKLPHSDGEGVGKLGYENLKCPPAPQKLSDYECAIYVLDREMGRVIDELEEQGILDDTIIVAAPDHGAVQDKHAQSRLYNYYQEVLSIPLFMRIPEKFQYLANNINPHWRDNLTKPTQNVDLLPTFVDLLNIEGHSLIEGIVKQLDGTSVFRDIADDRWVFSMNSNALRPWRPVGFSLTIGDSYKYIYLAEEEYLYDLHKDPGETVNLLKTERELVSDLYRDIQQFISQTHNARDAYVYELPGNVEYFSAFSRRYLGKDLPTVVGTVRANSDILYSNGEKGVLSYGPYLQLDKGRYEFNIHYSSVASNQPHTYSLGFVEKDRWVSLKQGSYRQGENKTLSVTVSIKREESNKNIEFINKFSGDGRFEIEKIEVFKVATKNPTQGE